MTREEAKQAVEVLTAYADGKKIEISGKYLDDWNLIDCKRDEICFNFDHFDYRVVKEPQYRPFTNMEECWNEMLKHQPFGWMEIKRDGERITLTYLTDRHSFADMFEKMNFADGEPFGVKIE